LLLLFFVVKNASLLQLVVGLSTKTRALMCTKMKQHGCDWMEFTKFRAACAVGLIWP